MKYWFSSFSIGMLAFFLASAASFGQARVNDYFGKPLAQWLECLRSDKAVERDEAVQVVGKIGPEAREAAPLLRPLLKDAAQGVRMQAALALWKVTDGDKDAAATLAADLPTLPQQQKYQVGAFVLALKKLDEPAATMLHALRKDPIFGVQVTYRLQAFGAAAVPLYSRWLEASMGKDRVALLAEVPLTLVVASRGEVVAPYLKDTDPRCQVEANASLLSLADRKESATETLIRLTEAKEAEASRRATSILCNQQSPTPKATVVYLRGLRHPELGVRVAAAKHVLALVPDRADEVVPVLAEALKGDAPQVRYDATQRLLELKERAEKFTPALMGLLKDPKLGNETYAVLTVLTPLAERVGKEIGEIIFADTATAARFHVPALGPFVPQFTDALLKHLDGEDATRKQMAAALARWAPAEHFAKLLPKVAPLIKNDALTDVVLRTYARQGTNARPAAPDVYALFDGKLTPGRIELLRRTMIALQPEPKTLDATLDKFKARKELSKDQRLLAAELALLHPGRRKEAAAFVAPLFADRQALRSTALMRILENLGRDGAALVPLFPPFIREDGLGVNSLEKALILMGPAARELGAVLSERAEKIIDVADLARIARILAAVDPARQEAAETRLNKLFLEALRNGLHEYYFRLLVAHCQDLPGPTKALLPLMLKVFRDHPRAILNGQVRADLAVPISRLDADAAAEVLRTLEDELGTFPQCSQVALLGLLRVNPEHPKALAELRKYLADSSPQSRALIGWIPVRCERVVPGVRERLETILKEEANTYARTSIRLTLMRYDGKLNPAWVDDLLRDGEQDLNALWDLPTLGALARPLLPRLRALPVSESQMNSYQDILFRIEQAVGRAHSPGSVQP